MSLSTILPMLLIRKQSTFRKLADTGEPHKIGKVGLSLRCLLSNRQQIGPEVTRRYHASLIEVVDAVRSIRATRRNRIARRWMAVDPDACRRYAEKRLRQGNGDSGWTQPCPTAFPRIWRQLNGSVTFWQSEWSMQFDFRIYRRTKPARNPCKAKRSWPFFKIHPGRVVEVRKPKRFR